MGQMLRPLIEQFERSMRQQFVPNGQPNMQNVQNASNSLPFMVNPWNPMGTTQMPGFNLSSFMNPTTPSSNQQKPTTSPSLQPKVQQPQQPTQQQSVPPVQQQTSQAGIKSATNYKLYWTTQYGDRPLLSSSSAPTAIPKCKQAMTDIGCTQTELALLDPLSDALNNENSPLPSGTYELFDKVLLEGIPAKLFPCLFVYRLLILRKSCNDHYTIEDSSKMQGILARVLSDSMPKGALLMALTTASNLFAFPNGIKFMISEPALGIVISATVKALGSSESSLRSIAAAVLYNYSLCLPRENDRGVECITAIVDVLQRQLDDETVYRLLVALGHFMLEDTAIKILVAELVKTTPILANLKSNSPKVSQIAKDFVALIF